MLFHIKGKEIAMKSKLDSIIARLIAPVAIAIAFSITFAVFAAYWA